MKQFHKTLYSAKRRLIPPKGLPIPRLELSAYLLLFKQMKAVFDAISTQIIWVEDRVEKIRSNVPVDCGRYIRTD